MSDTGTEANASTTDGTTATTTAAAAPAAAENTTSATTSGAGDEFKAITSQADLDRIIGDRVKREKAKFGDYEDLKAKAAKYDEVEEANKTELQKAIERAEAAEKDAATLRSTQQLADLKTQVSDKYQKAGYNIPPSVLSGTTLEEIEAHAESVKALLPAPRTPGNVPSEGHTVTTGSGDPAEQFAEILRQARNR